MAEDALWFAGYAALFDIEDAGGDVVRRGAFAGCGAVPLLAGHAGRAIGRLARIAEDARGLRVIGAVTDEAAQAALADGRLAGLSFGYRVRRAAGRRPRQLLAVELVEVSLVTAPMQAGARVHRIAG